jgi:hypothetical protein
MKIKSEFQKTDLSPRFPSSPSSVRRMDAGIPWIRSDGLLDFASRGVSPAMTSTPGATFKAEIRPSLFRSAFDVGSVAMPAAGVNSQERQGRYAVPVCRSA